MCFVGSVITVLQLISGDYQYLVTENCGSVFLENFMRNWMYMDRIRVMYGFGILTMMIIGNLSYSSFLIYSLKNLQFDDNFVCILTKILFNSFCFAMSMLSLWLFKETGYTRMTIMYLITVCIDLRMLHLFKLAKELF